MLDWQMDSYCITSLAWSSWNSTTAVEGGGAARGGAGRRRMQGGKAGRRRGQGEESEDGTYFQSGHIAEGKNVVKTNNVFS